MRIHIIVSCVFVSIGMSAAALEQLSALGASCDGVLEDSTLLNAVPADLAGQHHALLHALVVQKGQLCKSQRKELQQFCRSVKRSSLPLAVQRDLVGPLKQLVKHTRRNWIIGLSVVGGVIAAAGIALALQGKQSGRVSNRSTRDRFEITADDIMSGRALGSGMFTEASDSDALVTSGVKPPATPLRPLLNRSGPPGGSPGIAAGEKLTQFNQLDYSFWKQLLASTTVQIQNDQLFIFGCKMLMAAYDERILTEKVHSLIIDLCFIDDEAVVRQNILTDTALQASIRDACTRYEKTNFYKILGDFCEYLFSLEDE